MKSWTQPTADELDRVIALCARPENRAYFFERLENPRWVAPLAERGLFDHPPAPEQADEPGYVRFPPWPEGRYLARLAGEAPDSVAEVLARIDASENPVVTRIVLEAFASLPQTQARQLSERLIEWMGAPFADHFADEGAAAVLHLFDAGETSMALKAMKTLLAIEPDPRLAEKATRGDLPFRLPPEASARFSEWEYERVLGIVLDPAVAAAGRDAVRLLVGLLEDAQRMSRWDDEPAGTDDGSHSWRPAIEDHDQNWNTGIRDLLVSAVRDAVLGVASTGENDTVSLVRDLWLRSTIFRRIGLYVVAHSRWATNLVTELLVDYELFDDYRVRHEYSALLRTRFGDVDESKQERILEWIRAGPDLDAYRRVRANFDGSPPDEEDVAQYADRWRRDWYSFVAPHLKGADAERYQNLVDTFGEAEHPDFLSWSTSWSGPETPITQEELGQRPLDEVIEFLRRWRPEDDSGWHFGPSIEGLGRVFQSLVGSRAQECALAADLMRQLDPTYVRAFFSGIEMAVKEKTPVSWTEPLRLARWVTEQPFEPDEEVDDRDRDPDWRWCRREIASVIRSGLSEKPNQIPFNLRDEAWAVIQRLTDDPNPSPEHEARYGGDNMDPFTLSINTNRGTAMHAAVDYALWCRRELEKLGKNPSQGFNLMPEVRAVLERHLDRRQEPSLAVRAVYGRWLPWLLLLDEAWTVEHLSLIFPQESGSEAFADTAWATYIGWCPAYDSVFRALRSQYEDAVERVPSGRKVSRFGPDSVDLKLGEHLVVLYWRGVVDDALLGRYFERAGDELAAGVIGFVGRALRNTDGDVAAPVKQRIQTLWERRFAAAEADPNAHRGESKAFGLWFTSGKLDEDWAFSALERAVDRGGTPSFDHKVAERLAEIARYDPASAVRVFLKMSEDAERERHYLPWRDEAKEIAALALASSDPEASENARAIIDLYVRSGQLEFRELLRGSAGG